MCAICGMVKREKRVEPEVIKKMARIMSYRGPDEEGYYFNGNIGLGHRRLKIIDLYTGIQPMVNEDKTVYLICNGEIYNFKKLRENLEGKGHHFYSKSDNEVILHLYEEKGVDCVRYLRGMFAFAIWDGKEKLLFLARDRVGQKPLVYTQVDSDIVFASEIKSLLCCPGVSKEIDLTAVSDYLTYQAIPSPGTIFKKIRKLPPASYLIWKDGKIKIERYWDVDFTKKIRLGNEHEYQELLWEKLTEATKIRMISDVPLGAFLSGGIDSSSVVGIMSQFSTHPVKTFSIGFDEKDYSELEYAKVVAEHFGTEHHQFIVKPDIISILPKLIWHYNEPFADSSMVPTYYVAQQTRKYVTVALNGDGGDESLAGYPRYYQTKLLEKIYGILRRCGMLNSPFNQLYKKLYKKFPQHIVSRTLEWLSEAKEYGFSYAYARRLTSFSPEKKALIYSQFMKEHSEESSGFPAIDRIWEKTGNLNLVEKMLYSDFHLYLPEDLMVKIDIASMSNSLEGRSPFLDHKFIETIAGFPPELKLKNNISKYILKKKLKGFLPDEILSRRKMGFGVPIGEWFKKDLKDYIQGILLSDKSLKRPYFRAEGIKAIVEEHIFGKVNHSHRLWTLLCFELWHRIFIDGENYETIR